MLLLHVCLWVKYSNVRSWSVDPLARCATLHALAHSLAIYRGFLRSAVSAYNRVELVAGFI